MKNYLKLLAVAIVASICASPVAANPFAPGFGYDYTCPDASGDYLGGGSGDTFPSCKPLPTAPSATFQLGTLNARTFATGTAYQASDTSNPAVVQVTVTSTAALSLTAGTTNSVDLVVGSSSGIATSGGTVVQSYSNANTGTLIVGLALNQIVKSGFSFPIQPGQYFAFRVTSGSATLGNGSDASMHN